MSYEFFEDFSRYNDRGEPYSLFSEETVKYDVPDAIIDEYGYRILRQNAKQIIATPSLTAFSLTLSVILEKSVLTRGKTVNEWSVFFGYSREERFGKELRLTYVREDKTLTATLLDITAIKETEIASKTVEGFTLPLHTESIFNLEGKNDKLTLTIDGAALEFSTALGEGVIALSTSKGVNGILFKSVSLSSDVEPRVKSTSDVKEFVIPCYDGGEADNQLKISTITYENGVTEVNCTLDGGVYYTKVGIPNVSNWTAPYEHFVDPYIRLIKNGALSEKLYIKNGKVYFVAKDYENHSIENILDASEMPYSANFFFEALSGFDAIAFGYAAKLSFGHEFFGDKREYVFDLDGNLIYDGDELTSEYISRVKSNADKKIIDLIPKNLVDRDAAISHAKSNHAFLKGECAEFTALLHTKRDAEKISVKAELQNAYFKKIRDLKVTTKAISDVTDRFGYSTISTCTTISGLEQSVYHLALTWYYGDSVCHTHTSAFEVINTEAAISPQESAGLPLMYVGDGAPRDTTGVVPNMWSSKSDFSIEHYFSTAEYLPSVSEIKRPWELLSLYKRSTFVWMNQRTIGDRGHAAFPLSTANADYIYYYMPTVYDSSHSYRCDLWNVDVYDSPTVRGIFESFREAHPEFESILSKIPKDEPITVAHLKSMMPYCFDAWADFFNAEDARRLKAQWSEIKAQNPKVKRSSYGPFPLYGTNLAGGYHSKWFGMPPETMATLFDGFCQFEDYPFVCAYGSHYSAWGMMTIKQLSPEGKVAPELYDCFAAVCPDGFVAEAFPPLGESHAEPYMTSTQAYEYLYNTPALREDGSFTYWRDNCFMFYSLYMEEPNERMNAFMRDWGNYLDYAPKSPKKSIAYLTEFDTDDNRRETDIHDDSIYNLCQSGEAYIHECAAECGLSAGFVVDYSSINSLTPDMTDILVIPSMRNTSESVKNKIKALYEAGVALIAVGDVSGLEDVFGVKKDYRMKHVTRLYRNEESEHIFPYEAEFFYSPNGAVALLTTDEGTPVILKCGNAILINSSVNQVGVDNYKPLCFYGRPNISKLLKKAASEVLTEISKPYAKADRACGVTSFTAETGDDMLLLIDYSRYDELTDKKTYVKLFDSNITDIECITRPDIKIEKAFDGGVLKEFNITIKHHEALLFRLIK